MTVGRYSYRGHTRSWQRRPSAIRRSRLAAAGGAVVLLVGFGLLWGWRVQSVEVTGATIVPNAAVRDAVLSALQGSQLGWFPRSSMLLMRPRTVARTIQSQFAFADVSVQRRLNGAVFVTITEQPIVALVRRANGPATLLAGSGHLIALAPESLNGAEGLMEIRWGGPLPVLGERLIAPETLDFLSAVWGELRRSGGALQPLYLSDRAEQPVSFDFRTANGATVSVVVGGAPAHQLTKLRAVLQNYETPGARAKLRIIDLRYGDRVYVQ